MQHPNVQIDFDKIEKDLFLAVSKMMKWDCSKIENLHKDFKKSLQTKIEQLSDQFTHNRPKQIEPYFQANIDVAAYAMHFHAATMQRMMSVCAEIPPNMFSHQKRIRVLDIGAGTGAALQGFLFWLHQVYPALRVEADLLDQSLKVLTFAKNFLLSTTPYPEKIEIIPLDLKQEKLSSDAYDVVIACNVLNEIGGIENIHSIVEKMHSQSLLILIEPALFETSRLVMNTKKKWTNIGLHVLAPCTHDLDCPMLHSSKDWCHFETSWESGAFRKSMDHRLHHESILSYSYMILSKTGYEMNEKRVLSSVLKSRIKKVNCLQVCGHKQVEYLYFDKRNVQMKGIQKGQKLMLPTLDRYLDAKKYFSDQEAFWVPNDTDIKIK